MIRKCPFSSNLQCKWSVCSSEEATLMLRMSQPKYGKEFMVPRHRCYAQHSWHARKEGSEDRKAPLKIKRLHELVHSIVLFAHPWLSMRNTISTTTSWSKASIIWIFYPIKLQFGGCHHHWSERFWTATLIGIQDSCRKWNFRGSNTARMGSHCVGTWGANGQKKSKCLLYRCTGNMKLAKNIQCRWDIQSNAFKINVVSQ